MQEKTVTYYRQKVDEVLKYINNHLSEQLNIKDLSDQFCISFFHFHRIFKAILNEPLGNYIKRLRLETAVRLIRYSNDSLSQIALSIGYNDLSSFSKAFTKEFGISPNVFRANRNILLNTHINYHFNNLKIISSDVKPKVIIMHDKNVAFIRVKGIYGGPEVYKAWNELGDFIIKNGLTGWKQDIFSVYYDEPEIVGAENCTSDICVATKKKFNTNGRIGSKMVRGGKFAVFRYKGPYERLWELYDKIYKSWVLTTDMKLRDLPIIEKYLNYSEKTKPDDLLTEIYIPVE